MGRVLRILAGMLMGAMVAGGLVLIFTPQSGDDTRKLLEEWFEQVRAEGRQAADVRRLELQSQFEASKRPGG